MKNVLGTILACAALLMPVGAAAQSNNTSHSVYLPPEELSCPDAADKVMHGDPTKIDPAEMDILLMKHRECLAEAWNTAHPEDPIVAVATYDPKEEKVLFGTIKVRDAQALVVVCKGMASIVTGEEFSGDPLTFAIAGAAGNYGCDSYLQAAVRNDPMLILLPTYVPGMRLYGDLWREIRKATSTIEGREIGGLIPGTNVPLFLVAPPVAASVAAAEPLENIRRESTRAAENITRESGRGAGNAVRETGRAGQNIGREARRACRRIFRGC